MVLVVTTTGSLEKLRQSLLATLHQLLKEFLLLLAASLPAPRTVVGDIPGLTFILRTPLALTSVMQHSLTGDVDPKYMQRLFIIYIIFGARSLLVAFTALVCRATGVTLAAVV